MSLLAEDNIAEVEIVAEDASVVPDVVMVTVSSEVEVKVFVAVSALRLVVGVVASLLNANVVDERGLGPHAYICDEPLTSYVT
jgi:hypothetical protein